MRIAIVGANGQLGTDLMHLLEEAKVVSLYHRDIEIMDIYQVDEVLDAIDVEVVINLAAYHRVDECESQPNRALLVNGMGLRNLALNCQRHGRVLMHFSTDYVFDGRAGRPYHEDDPPLPLSAYGNSEVSGEHFVRAICDRYYLIRTSGLYGLAGSSGKGGNFVETMLRLAGEGQTIRVVDDQVLSPTSTADLALKVLELLETGRYGLYHITNAGWCSWYEFAAAIFNLAGVKADLRPTTSAEYGAPARRPAFSALENRRLQQIGLAPLRPWQEALAAYLAARRRA
ncbi:MAG: dTDP-4-dehydrorhamnose reductase [Deinococcus sp.]|nr:dTDP-4-dehydrorhamnose reductase [Deinococcus sp.]